MHFYGSNLGPLARGHLGLWDLHLNKLGRGALGMLHTKFQTSGLSGSEEEDFLIYFYAFLWFEPRTPGQRPPWTLGPWFEQTW